MILCSLLIAESITLSVRHEDGSIENIDSSERILWYFDIENHFIDEGIVVIPKLQNTSQEFKLPIRLGFNENQTFILSTQVLRDLEGNFVYKDINVTVIEDISTNIRYSLAVISARQTSEVIADRQLLDERAVALMDVPIYRTFEGYILREGFRFTYYWIDWEGEASKLDLQR